MRGMLSLLTGLAAGTTAGQEFNAEEARRNALAKIALNRDAREQAMFDREQRMDAEIEAAGAGPAPDGGVIKPDTADNRDVGTDPTAAPQPSYSAGGMRGLTQPQAEAASTPEAVRNRQAAVVTKFDSAKGMRMQADMIRINAEQMRKLHKKARIDDFSDLSRFRPQMTYFHDYNVVESVLLFVIVLVNLSGIMFESGQLGNIQSKTLTYLIILIVSASILYFMWVLFSEVWLAFYPDKPLFGMKPQASAAEPKPTRCRASCRRSRPDVPLPLRSCPGRDFRCGRLLRRRTPEPHRHGHPGRAGQRPPRRRA